MHFVPTSLRVKTAKLADATDYKTGALHVEPGLHSCAKWNILKLENHSLLVRVTVC